MFPLQKRKQNAAPATGGNFLQGPAWGPFFFTTNHAMAKSRETFNKRNRELKKKKQKEDKLQKKEDRRAQGGTGKNLEDMMAYVDENGNLSSTPPDHPLKHSA